jgi:polysaccharide pyruvyl transferase WcaK-like protein
VTPLVRHLETRGAARQAWVRACVGRRSAAPYVVAKGDFAALQRVVFSGVGGVGLPLCEPALRAEVLAALAAADAVGVRDRCTLRHLQAAGIAAALSPDPAALVAELFGARIAAAGGQGDAAAADARFRSSGYLAAQCSAEFGDDTTLGMLAAQLDGFAAAAGLGLVFFRAGTAPWHDDLELYRRLALRVRVPSQVATSTDLWQLVALIAQSRGFCGSSLHGNIVAAAFGLPRLALRAPAGPRPAKVEAYTDAWELPGLPGSAAIADLGRGLRRAFAADRTALAAHAARLALQARAGFAALQAVLLG